MACDHLVPARHQQLASLPEDRKGKHTRDAIQDAALGAFAVFLTQSPSCLASQRTRPHANGRSNAESLWRMGASPCENQLRTWLDPVVPTPLLPVFAAVYAALQGAGHRWSWRVCADQRLIALDGTEYGAAQESHWARGSQRTHPNGKVTYGPQAITPGIVAPGKHEGITLAPAFITPPAGPAQQDGEQVAAQRWSARQAGRSRRVPI